VPTAFKTILTGGVTLMLLVSVLASLSPVLIRIALDLGHSPKELNSIASYNCISMLPLYRNFLVR
jgi:hypothetical protein